MGRVGRTRSSRLWEDSVSASSLLFSEDILSSSISYLHRVVCLGDSADVLPTTLHHRHVPNAFLLHIYVDWLRTGLLLLKRELVPVDLHAIPQRHPQIGLLLGWHGLPPLLNVRECRVGDGVRASRLLLWLLLPRERCEGGSGRASGLHCGRETGGRSQHRRGGFGGAERWREMVTG